MSRPIMHPPTNAGQILAPFQSHPATHGVHNIQCSHRVHKMCFFVLFFGLEVLFFPNFGEITIKMVIFVHLKYFKRNISELSLR